MKQEINSVWFKRDLVWTYRKESAVREEGKRILEQHVNTGAGKTIRPSRRA